MAEEVKKYDPRRHLNDEQRQDLKEYGKKIARELAQTNFSEEEKTKMYDEIMMYQTNYAAMCTVEKQYYALKDKLERINERYKREPDDEKAQKYVEQYKKNKAQQDEVERRYYAFRDQVLLYEHRMIEYNEKIDKALGIERKQEPKTRN